MIKLMVNGREMQCSAGCMLAGLLAQQGYAGEKIAVECNGVIIPRVNYDSYLLQHGDVLEIVTFVGGG